MSCTLHTSLGDIKIEIYCDLVPKTSENFLALAASGYYDNTIFHRNMKNFIVQGGDPTGSGKGGASIWNAVFEDEFHPELKHDQRGMISMANKGANSPNTNGSQFFIIYGPQPHLNNLNTVFATIIDGFEVLDAMEKVSVGEKFRPVTDIKIKNITIHANPLAG